MGRLRDFWWALRHTFDPKHRYNIVRTGLAPGYYDLDTRMLHACMSLLVSYVEHEHGGEAKMKEYVDWCINDPDVSNDQGATEQTALAIYRWWKHERPAAHAAHDEECSILFTPLTIKDRDLDDARREHHARDDALEAKDQEMLHALIDIRRSLWT